MADDIERWEDEGGFLNGMACRTCFGTGYLLTTVGRRVVVVECPDCQGSGIRNS